MRYDAQKGQEDGCGVPMACAALGTGTAGTALTLIGGTAGITKSGDFRFYANSWPGNQYITTHDVAKVGKVIGGIGFTMGLASDISELGKENISAGKVSLNTAMGALGFTSAWPVAISYGLTDLFGAQIGGGAIDMLIQGQQSGIQDAMTIPNYQQ